MDPELVRQMIEYQSAVDKLSPDQKSRWNVLMGQNMSDWPDSLKEHVQSQPRYCGEDFVEAVAEWVLRQS